MSRPIGVWPYEQGPHKNGDRVLGYYPERVADVWRSGRAPVSILLRSSVTALVNGVRIGDELSVDFDGRFWWASMPEGVVGRLTWGVNDEARVTWFDYQVRYPRVGQLVVRRLLLSEEGEVVNLQGYVVAS